MAYNGCGKWMTADGDLKVLALGGVHRRADDPEWTDEVFTKIKNALIRRANASHSTAAQPAPRIPIVFGKETNRT